MQYEFLNINFTGPFGLRMHFVFHCYSHFVFSNGSTLIFKTINSLDFLKLHQHLGSILFGIDEHKCIFIKDFFFVLLRFTFVAAFYPLACYLFCQALSFSFALSFPLFSPSVCLVHLFLSQTNEPMTKQNNSSSNNKNTTTT